jgi:hypothetical protein
MVRVCHSKTSKYYTGIPRLKAYLLVSFTGSIQDNWHSPREGGGRLLWAEITYRGLAKKFPEGFYATLKPSLARHLSQLTAEFKENRRSRFFFRGPWVYIFLLVHFCHCREIWDDFLWRLKSHTPSKRTKTQHLKYTLFFIKRFEFFRKFSYSI